MGLGQTGGQTRIFVAVSVLRCLTSGLTPPFNPAPIPSELPDQHPQIETAYVHDPQTP